MPAGSLSSLTNPAFQTSLANLKTTAAAVITSGSLSGFRGEAQIQMLFPSPDSCHDPSLSPDLLDAIAKQTINRTVKHIAGKKFCNMSTEASQMIVKY